MFKVGDRVKQKESGWNTSPEDDGKIATIVQIEGKYLKLDDVGFVHKVDSPSRNQCAFELISESKDFKIGDIVRISKERFYTNKPVGTVWEIIMLHEEEGHSGRYYRIGEVGSRESTHGEGRNISGAYHRELELVTSESSNSSQNTVGKIMNNIKTFVKNLALSGDEKLLRKFGFKSDCGEYTQDAKDLAILRLCEEKEKEMVEIAKGLEKEEKTK